MKNGCQIKATVLFLLDKSKKSYIVSPYQAEVVKWQTRQTQNLVPSRACGFKSHLRYHKKFKRLLQNLKKVSSSLFLLFCFCNGNRVFFIASLCGVSYGRCVIVSHYVCVILSHLCVIFCKNRVIIAFFQFKMPFLKKLARYLLY